MKIIGLSTVAFGFAILMALFTDVHTEVSFTRWDSISFDLGPIGWVFWAAFIIIAMSNAVNLTDGLDGLAAEARLLCVSAHLPSFHSGHFVIRRSINLITL